MRDRDPIASEECPISGDWHHVELIETAIRDVADEDKFIFYSFSNPAALATRLNFPPEISADVILDLVKLDVIGHIPSMIYRISSYWNAPASVPRLTMSKFFATQEVCPEVGPPSLGSVRRNHSRMRC